MTLASLQALTWGTVTGAVVSALLLAAGEPVFPDLSRWRRGDAARPVRVESPATSPEATVPAPVANERRPVSATVGR